MNVLYLSSGGCIGRPQRPACSKCATNLMGKEGVQLGEGQFEGHLQRELYSCQTVSHLPVCHCNVQPVQVKVVSGECVCVRVCVYTRDPLTSRASDSCVDLVQEALSDI